MGCFLWIQHLIDIVFASVPVTIYIYPTILDRAFLKALNCKLLTPGLTFKLMKRFSGHSSFQILFFTDHMYFLISNAAYAKLPMQCIVMEPLIACPYIDVCCLVP